MDNKKKSKDHLIAELKDLRKQYEQLLSMTENIKDMMYRMSLPDGKYEYVSSASIDLFGYTPEEFYKSPVLIKKIIHPDWYDYFDKQWPLLVEGKMPPTYEYQIKTKSGETKWMNQRNHLICDKNGKPNALEGIVTDITDRKRAEEKLVESEKFFKDISYSMGDWVWEIDKNCIFTYCSGNVEKNLGYSPEEIVGKTLFDFMPPEEVRRSKKIFSELIKNKASIHDYENWNIKKDTSHVCLLTNGIPLFDEKRNLIGYRGVNTDITERKTAEEALRESEEKYRAIIENSTDWIWTIDLNGRHTYSNPAVKSILGFTEDEIIGSQSLDLLHVDDREKVEKSLGEWIKKRQGWSNLVLRWRHKTGSYRYLESNAVPWLNSGGELVGFRGVDRDITDRIMIEKERKRAADIFNNIQAGLYLYHLEDINDYEGKTLRMIDANPASHTLTGVSPEDVRGKTLDENFPYLRDSWVDNKGRSIPEVYAEVVRTGKPEEIEQVVYSDNRVIEGAFSIKVFPLPNNSVGVSFENILKRKRAEASMQKSSVIIESTSDAVFTTGIKGIITSWNRGAENIYGYKKDEIIGKPISIIYNDENYSLFKSVISKLMKGEEIHNIEVTCIDKNQQNVEILLSLTTIKDKNGNVTELVGVTKDITVHKQALKELYQTVTLLEAQLDSTLEGILVVDPDGKKILQNKRTVEIWNIPQHIADDVDDDPQVQHVMSLTVDPEKFIEKVKYLYKHPKETSRDEVELKDGRIVDRYSAPVIGKDGNNYGRIWTFRDITERKQLEEERLKASKLESIGLLAGGIAHDFNNILASILGNTSLVKLKLDPNSEEYKMLSESENASIRATNLTQQLLTFAKGGAPVKELSELTDLIRETTEFSLRGTNVNCRMSLPKDLWTVDVDKGQIGQVIGNIVINALQAMPNGGTIRIKAKNVKITSKDKLPLGEGKYVKISIADKGQGISTGQLKNIFDPYFTTKKKGSGLGLTTSYSIIHRHHGYIAVESEIGEGTTFHIYLPASLKRISAEKVVKKELNVQTGNILVMDDDNSILKVVGIMLKSLGNVVEVCCDGTKAIELYEKALNSANSFDAVIMDLTIPGGMGGKETIQKLLEIDPEVRAIVSSGYSNDPVVSNFKEHGFRGYISKPYRIEDLKNVLNEVLK